MAAVQVKAQGTYISDKIDLLIEYLLVDPFQSLFRRAFKQDVGILSYSVRDQSRHNAADLLLPCRAIRLHGTAVERSRLPAVAMVLGLSLCACC